jgi:hypothetical protein
MTTLKAIPQQEYTSLQSQMAVVQNFQVMYGKFNIWGPFEKFVGWQQCAAVMQREVVTVMPSCSGGSNVVVA